MPTLRYTKGASHSKWPKVFEFNQARNFKFEITRPITPWIVLHSVQLLLLIIIIIIIIIINMITTVTSINTILIA